MDEVVGHYKNHRLSDLVYPDGTGHAGPCTGASVSHAVKERIHLPCHGCGPRIARVKGAIVPDDLRCWGLHFELGLDHIPEVIPSCLAIPVYTHPLAGKGCETG